MLRAGSCDGEPARVMSGRISGSLAGLGALLDDEPRDVCG